MKNVRGRLALVLMTLMLLLVLALGPAAPAPLAGVEVFDNLHGLLCPSAHGGSSA
jgi:hypothetical protein